MGSSHKPLAAYLRQVANVSSSPRKDFPNQSLAGPPPQPPQPPQGVWFQRSPSASATAQGSPVRFNPMWSPAAPQGPWQQPSPSLSASARGSPVRFNPVWPTHGPSGLPHAAPLAVSSVGTFVLPFQAVHHEGTFLQ